MCPASLRCYRCTVARIPPRLTVFERLFLSPCDSIVQGPTPCLEAVDSIVVSHVAGRERGRAHGNELTFILPMASVSWSGSIA